MKLVIFDLDQTLVDFISIHDEATRIIFRQLFGIDAKLRDIDFAGKSLTDNFIELARHKNVPDDKVRACLPELLPRYEAIFAQCLPADASGHILPGVIPLLDELSRTDSLVVLYTGDSPGIVREVFRVTGLGKYFRFAVYGTEVATRADMVELAIRRAEDLAGRQFRGRDTVVIGDSVRDIEVGKRFGAVTIAVATGFHPEEKLRERQPDYLFRDLSDFARVLEVIGASPVAQKGVS